MALLGLMGQSGAMAMVPTPMAGGSTQASMAGMNCMDIANAHDPAKSPCKKITMHCMVAMGCAPLFLAEPVGSNAFQVVIGRLEPVLPLAARLWGRSYGPELDPPSLLI